MFFPPYQGGIEGGNAGCFNLVPSVISDLLHTVSLEGHHGLQHDRLSHRHLSIGKPIGDLGWQQGQKRL
jgi:hypothetical protein